MASPFLGQISVFSFNFVPRYYAACNGQSLSIAQNTALFSLLGTTYGGNGSTTFNLPDLRGRSPLHTNLVFPLGLRYGEEAHTLTPGEMPQHTHQAMGDTRNGNNPIPTNNIMASAQNVYQASNTTTTIVHPNTISITGSSQPHNNMGPFLVLQFCIALAGTYPSRN